MAPWVLAYYASVPIAARHIADRMVPQLDKAIRPEHAVIHSHRIGREFLAQASLSVARKRGLPFVLTAYHHPRWHGYRYSGWTNVYRAADAVLTLTAAEVNDLVRLGVPRKRLHVVGAAIEHPMAGSAPRFRALIRTEDRPIILFLGQQFEYKGVGQLLVAADALHASGLQFELVFLGPETRFSRKLFADHSRPWLHELGRADDQLKWDAIEAAAAICVPSSQESFGLVFLEAWSKKKPVIGGRIPSVSEVITDGRTGLLVDPASPNEVAAAIKNLLTNQELSDRLGNMGKRELQHRFNWERVASRVEAAYDAVLLAARPAIR